VPPQRRKVVAAEVLYCIHNCSPFSLGWSQAQ